MTCSTILFAANLAKNFLLANSTKVTAIEGVLSVVSYNEILAGRYRIGIFDLCYSVTIDFWKMIRRGVRQQ